MPACKLTPEVEEKVLEWVNVGATLIEAARKEGVTAGTARNWVKWGNAGREPYKAFVEKLDIAEASPKLDALRAWHRTIKEDWRAAKAYLDYLTQRQDSPANIERHIEEILQAVEDTLGADEAKKVLSAIVERASSEEAGKPGPAVRLVATR